MELQPGRVDAGRAVGLGGRLPAEGCQPCWACWASRPPLLPNCTFFSRAGKDDRPDCDSRVRVSLCRWGIQATSLPEKINKNPSDISITVGLKIIPQHADSSCHVHVDVYVRLCHLTFAVRRGNILLACSVWEPWGMPGLPPSTLRMSWLRTSPAPSWLPLCLSSLGGQGTGSTFCSVCSVLGGEAPLSMRFLSSKFLHPVCSIQSWRGQIKTLSMWFRAGGTHEVFQSRRAQGRWLGWA